MSLVDIKPGQVLATLLESLDKMEHQKQYSGLYRYLSKLDVKSTRKHLTLEDFLMTFVDQHINLSSVPSWALDDYFSELRKK